MARSLSITNGKLVKAKAQNRSVLFSETGTDATIAVSIEIPQREFQKHNAPVPRPPIGEINLDFDNNISDDVPEVYLTSTSSGRTTSIYLNMKVKINGRKVNLGEELKKIKP